MHNAPAPRAEGRRRLTAAEERNISERIRAAEAETHTALRGIPEAAAILRRGAPQGAWRTRVGEVELIQEALLAAEAAERCPSTRAAAAQARRAWDRTVALQWELAVSASHVVPHEARHVASASGIDEADLIHEGYIGLLRAAVRFDPARGVRFPTYGRWWARAQMTRAVDSGGRAVRLTGAAVEQLRNLRRARTAREAAGLPTHTAELAADTGIGLERAEMLLASPQVVSLECPVLDDEPEGRRLGDRIASNAEDAEEIATSADLLEQLRAAVAAIPDDRARYVLSRHYGLGGHEPTTLAEIGRSLGLSRERVRQIEATALRWLREESALAEPPPEPESLSLAG